MSKKASAMSTHLLNGSSGSTHHMNVSGAKRMLATGNAARHRLAKKSGTRLCGHSRRLCGPLTSTPGSQCVVSPGSGGASSSSAMFFRSSPNERNTSGLTLLRRTTSPSGVTATTRCGTSRPCFLQTQPSMIKSLATRSAVVRVACQQCMREAAEPVASELRGKPPYFGS